LEKVVSAIRDFIEDVVLEVTRPSNERTSTAILSTHVEPFFDAKHDTLIAKLQEILLPIRESYPLALDTEFQYAMENKANKRKLAEKALNTQAGDATDSDVFGVEQTYMGQFGTEHIVDTVQTFYEVRTAHI
jgi:hypothetical protein